MKNVIQISLGNVHDFIKTSSLSNQYCSKYMYEQKSTWFRP